MNDDEYNIEMSNKVRELHAKIHAMAEKSKAVQNILSQIDANLAANSLDVESINEQYIHFKDNPDYQELVHGVGMQQVNTLFNTLDSEEFRNEPEYLEIHNLHKDLVKELYPGLDMRKYRRKTVKKEAKRTAIKKGPVK